MRKLIPRAILLTACLYATKTEAAGIADTTAAVHVIDGNSNEWKPDKFETDKESQLSYAADHDARYLYVVLKVPDQRMQLKIMRQGMNMYLDKKGKKREGMGIGFPIRQNQPVTNFSRGGRNGGVPGEQPASQPDPKAMREMLASTMVLLRTFGFDDQEDNLQPIAQPDKVNISFDWDASEAMVIEYLVPMSFLGKTNDLNGKPLGIGWKINGMQSPEGGGFSPSAAPAGRPSGGAGNRGGTRTGSGPALELPSFGDARFREQNIWTKYTLNF